MVRTINNKIDSLTGQNWPVQNLFIDSEFTHNGNTYKEYLLTRDGFAFVVMGFTGPEADVWKLKYIEAFNKMEKALTNQILIRQDAMESRLQDVVRELKEQAEFNHRPSHATKLNWNKIIREYSQCSADAEGIKMLVFKLKQNGSYEETCTSSYQWLELGSDLSVDNQRKIALVTLNAILRSVS